jgi:CBS domain containing-hemolysin-like protein
LVISEGEYETLAGFLLDRLGHIPGAGETIEFEGWTLRVEAMDRRRIAEVRVQSPTYARRLPASGTTGGELPKLGGR